MECQQETVDGLWSTSGRIDSFVPLPVEEHVDTSNTADDIMTSVFGEHRKEAHIQDNAEAISKCVV